MGQHTRDEGENNSVKTTHKEKNRISKIHQRSKTLEIRWFLPSLLTLWDASGSL